MRWIARMRSAAGLALAAGCTVLTTGCNECSGTPSCRGAPQISYSGQFVERRSGNPVGGVSVSFERRAGVELNGAAPRGSSDAEGFFAIRASALEQGSVVGDLQVIPPPPYARFTIPGIEISTSDLRGDGYNAGRLVVDPYVFMIGRVYDRKTRAPLVGARVLVRVPSGVLENDSAAFESDVGGQISWEPRLLVTDTIRAAFELNVSGAPRTYSIKREIPISYRDMETRFVYLPVGWGLAYSGGTVRRGSYEALAGVTVEFRRLSGIAIQPEKRTLSLDRWGSFAIAVEPLQEGTLTGQIKILPPPRFPPESSVVKLRTSDDDVVQTLGFFRYGAQAYFTARLRDSASGQLLPKGVEVRLQRVAGQQLDWTHPPADSGRRTLDSLGAFVYQAPTVDSGSVAFDVEVRLRKPLLWDTLRNVTIPARYSDASFDAGFLRVRMRSAP